MSAETAIAPAVDAGTEHEDNNGGVAKGPQEPILFEISWEAANKGVLSWSLCHFCPQAQLSSFPLLFN